MSEQIDCKECGNDYDICTKIGCEAIIGQEE
jgi:hypothetical protein